MAFILRWESSPVKQKLPQIKYQIENMPNHNVFPSVRLLDIHLIARNLLVDETIQCIVVTSSIESKGQGCFTWCASKKAIVPMKRHIIGYILYMFFNYGELVYV